MSHSLFSCLLPLTTIFISYDKSSQLETMQQHIMSHSHNLCLSYEFHHKLNKPFYRYWSLHVNHEYLALNFLLQLCLPLWVPQKLTSFNIILEPSYHTWIPCSSIFLSHSSLSHTMITNWDIHNCLQYMSYIISQIKYLLIISHKQVSPLIVLSINTSKPTRGLDALSQTF